jgi:prepilin-type processing-associated H-X9-DG protein
MNTDSNYVTTIIGYADYAMNAWLTNHYLDGHYSTAPLPTDETATLSRISAPANKMFMVDGISTYTYQPITSPHYQQSFGTYLSWQRHRGRLNVIYVDGHAVNMLRDDVPLNWNDPFWAGN